MLSKTQHEIAKVLFDAMNHNPDLIFFFSHNRTGKSFLFDNMEVYLRTCTVPTIKGFQEFFKARKQNWMIDTLDDSWHVRQLIEFICKKQLTLDQYDFLLVKLIEPWFEVTLLQDIGPAECKAKPVQSHYELVHDIIRWENGEQRASLEETIREKYRIKLLTQKVKSLLNYG